jgi:hypothetical protein
MRIIGPPQRPFESRIAAASTTPPSAMPKK